MNEIGFMSRLKKDKDEESKFYIKKGGTLRSIDNIHRNTTIFQEPREESPQKETTGKIIDLNVERHNWKKIDRSKLSLATQNELQDEEE